MVNCSPRESRGDGKNSCQEKDLGKRPDKGDYAPDEGKLPEKDKSSEGGEQCKEVQNLSTDETDPISTLSKTSSLLGKIEKGYKGVRERKRDD